MASYDHIKILNTIILNPWYHSSISSQSLVICSQELAKQLKAEVLSKFHDAGVKIFMISIGPADRGFKFHELTGFPTEYLLADPENVTYSALGLKSDTFSAFFSPEVCSAPRHP